MMRTWIVGYDYSPQAERALEWAAQLLEGLGGGRLVVVHAHLPGSVYGIDGLSRATFEDVEKEVLDAAKKALVERVAVVADRHPTVACEPRVELGPAQEVVVSQCELENAEQVVVGSHGRRGVNGFLLGSVAERIVHVARVPVLVVKDRG